MQMKARKAYGNERKKLGENTLALPVFIYVLGRGLFISALALFKVQRYDMP